METETPEGFEIVDRECLLCVELETGMEEGCLSFDLEIGMLEVFFSVECSEFEFCRELIWVNKARHARRINV